MKIAKKDWFFIALIVAVVGGFYAISGKVTTKQVPNNEQHKQFYAMVAAGGLDGMKAADKHCPECHNENGGIPFPANHPVKPKDGPMSCHLCHKYQAAK